MPLLPFRLFEGTWFDYYKTDCIDIIASFRGALVGMAPQFFIKKSMPLGCFMFDAERYIRTETKFSVVGSIAVTVLFYVLAFGLLEPVSVRGLGRYAFDFLPQSFMTALICTWLPGLITRKRAKTGAIAPVAPFVGERRSVLLTGLAFGLASLILGGFVVAGMLYLSRIETIDWTIGLVGKILFAGIVAVIITPAGLRRLLGTRPQVG